MQSSQDEIVLVPSYGITGVFTPPQHRRRGYAAHMMSLLHWVLANKSFRSCQAFPPAWGTPPDVPQGVGDGHWSALYSDISSEFYQKCAMIKGGQGWVVNKPFSTVWNVKNISESHNQLPFRTFEWLDAEAAEDLWKQERQWMARDMAYALHDSERNAISFLPDQGVAAMQVQRTIDVSSGRFASSIWGVRLSTSSHSNNSQGAAAPTYATWTFETEDNIKILLISRLRCSSLEFPNLLAVLRQAAESEGAKKIEVWNLPPELLVIAENHVHAQTISREEHLPSLAWYGDVSVGQPNWAFNEK